MGRSRSSRRERSGSSSNSRSKKPRTNAESGGSRRKRRSGWRFDSPPREEHENQSKRSAFSGPPSGGGDINTVLGAQANLKDTGVTNFSNIAAAIGLDAASAKAAREIYVGNIPAGIEMPKLVEFLNAAMIATKANTLPGNPASKAWISADGHYAFVELRTMEEASNALQLSGLNCMGSSLRIGRPRTFPTELQALIPPPTIPALDPTSGGSYFIANAEGHSALVAAQTAANAVAAGISVDSLVNKLKAPERLCIFGFPKTISTPDIRKIITTFGCVTFFDVLQNPQDPDHIVSSNVACLVDYDESASQKQAMEILREYTSFEVMLPDEACQKLKLGPYLKPLIKYLNFGEIPPINHGYMNYQTPTRVLMLNPVITTQELDDSEAYNEIIEDISHECRFFGSISIKIPKPLKGFEDGGNIPVGYCYVKMNSKKCAARARAHLNSRKYNGKIIKVDYFSEKRYNEDDFSNPIPNFLPPENDLELLEGEIKGSEAPIKFIKPQPMIPNGMITAAHQLFKPVSMAPSNVITPPSVLPPNSANQLPSSNVQTSETPTTTTTPTLTSTAPVETGAPNTSTEYTPVCTPPPPAFMRMPVRAPSRPAPAIILPSKRTTAPGTALPPKPKSSEEQTAYGAPPLPANNAPPAPPPA